jgi:hypothetical protein
MEDLAPSWRKNALSFQELLDSGNDEAMDIREISSNKRYVFYFRAMARST